ncbi:MAG TPA: glycosyltransferase family 1 protein [Candidatus Binatia bacterium]|jgi:glycosyltransferase involved in cell wall biosynthesis|nr:glycosyltransferase family 1 protein [Candidatus Binatia bacterium]
MRIGVDAACWQNTRGYGRHARALLTALVRLNAENQYTFFTDSTQSQITIPAEAAVRMVYSTTPTVVAASANGHRSTGDMWRMSRAMSDPALDIVLFPTVYSYVPVFGRSKKLVMIHDVIAEKYPNATLPTLRARLFWKTKVSLACWQADAIATVSEYSRERILKHFRLSPERVFVIGEASDPIFRRLDDPKPSPRLISLGIARSGRFIVYVGGFSPHKNLETLIAVFATLSRQSEFHDLRLVMVGEYEKEIFHSYFGTIKKQVEKFGLAERVIFTGYLPDDELVVLLNLSTVLVLPSLMEGFGLPAIEAAASGCPVIATIESALPRVLGNGAIYINPNRPEDLEQALVRVLESDDLRRQMRAAGLVAARRLSWGAAARQLIQVMEKVVIQ